MWNVVGSYLIRIKIFSLFVCPNIHSVREWITDRYGQKMMNKGPLGYMHMNTHCTHLFTDVTFLYISPGSIKFKFFADV